LLRSSETLAKPIALGCSPLHGWEWTVDFPKVSKRVLWMARDLDDGGAAAAMEATGATLSEATGDYDLRSSAVGSDLLVARRAVVIATQHRGDPADPRPGYVEYWTSRQAAIPKELPARCDPRRCANRRRAGQGLSRALARR